MEIFVRYAVAIMVTFILGILLANATIFAHQKVQKISLLVYITSTATLFFGYFVGFDAVVSIPIFFTSLFAGFMITREYWKWYATKCFMEGRTLMAFALMRSMGEKEEKIRKIETMIYPKTGSTENN